MPASFVPRRTFTVLLLLLWHAAALAGAQSCSASSGPMRTALLELFTSEGCSSCPPADRWLSGMLTQAESKQRPVQLA